jgi:hypothetical protein
VTPGTWTSWKIRLLDLAETTDAWRLFPRLIIAAYGWLCWDLSRWFMSLKAPTSEQMAFVTVILGLATPLIGLYLQTGRKWQ